MYLVNVWVVLKIKIGHWRVKKIHVPNYTLRCSAGDTCLFSEGMNIQSPLLMLDSGP